MIICEIARYPCPTQLDVGERFLCFVDISTNQNADLLVSALVHFSNSSNLDKVPIIGQSYDGANFMSGFMRGAQAKLREVYPQAKNAIYVHCMAHRLNLVVVDMCKHLKVKILKYIGYVKNNSH